MPAFTLTPLDYWMVAIYLVVIVAIGFWVARQTQTTEDYFLAGRSLTWPIIGFSLFASNISSSSLIGLAGAAYDWGIGVYSYEWFAVVVLVLFVVVFLPIYLRGRIYTIPEYLERRYNATTRLTMSGLSIVGNVLLEIAGALYAGALVIQLLYPDLSLTVIIVVLALLAGLYTVAGGLKAVVYTDTLQAVLLLGGACFVAFEAFQRVGSWAAVEAVTTPEMRGLILPMGDPNLPWLGLVTGLPLLGIYYWCSNQYMVQRALGARTLDDGRWGALFAGLLKLPVLFIMVMPGLFARVLYPDITRADAVFPTLLFDLLPAGIRGLVLIALIAALMSSLDSTLNAVSTLVTMDFVRKFRPRISDRQLVRVGRWATVIVMILGTLWAPQIVEFPSLWQYLQAVLAYITPPIVACFLLGVFWKRANAPGATAALLGGEAVGMTVGLLLAFGVFELHFLYVAAWLFVLSVGIHVVVSLQTPAPEPEQVEALVWTRATWEAETAALAGKPWYANYRIQSAILLVLTGIIVGIYF